MGLFRLSMFCFLLAVTFCQKLSKERMLDYFQYTNVTEDDIDDLITNVNSYTYVSNRKDAAERWANNRIQEDAENYAGNLSNFVGSLHFANQITRVMFLRLNRTQIVPEEEFKKVKQQYYIDQELLYGNDIMYSFCSMYVNYMEKFNFINSKMEELRKAQEEKLILPEYYSDVEFLQKAYKTLKWDKLYVEGGGVLRNATDSDSVKNRLFKEMLDKMISLF